MNAKLRKLSTAGAILFLMAASPMAQAFDVWVSQAPDNDLSLTLAAIKSAKQSLLINIYEFTSSDIADAVIDRIQAGVQVVILQEGAPFNGMSAAARGIQAQILHAMQGNSNDHLFEMVSAKESGHKRRFRYDHAKYMVIDGMAVLIGSENYSPTGNPTEGVKGNRGWEVLISNPDLARDFTTMFTSDTDTSIGDVEDAAEAGNRGRLAVEPSWMEVRRRLPSQDGQDSGNWGSQTQQEAPHFDAAQAVKITSPETSLQGLQDFIGHAQKTLDIETMTFTPNWGRSQQSSPLLDAVIAAARRGVHVRVLLNDETVFSHHGGSQTDNETLLAASKPKNPETVRILQEIAQKEGLSLEARIADVRAMGVDYIHNKGALADDRFTLISSINWDQNAVENNREAAVVLDSSDIHNYYGQIFDHDWGVSGDTRNRAWVRDPADDSVRGMSSRAADDEDNSDNGDIQEPCPDHLHIDAFINDVDPSVPGAASYAGMSHVEISGDFVRSPRSRGCLLLDQFTVNSTSKRRYVQIRTRRDGVKTVTLEGYTPNRALFSVHAYLPVNGDLLGEFSAGLYEGSGSRHKLADAMMRITN